MPKNSRRSIKKAWLWRSPCLIVLTLLVFIAAAAAMVQRGIIKTGSVKAALLGGAIIAGLAGLAGKGKEELRPVQLMIGTGIPALILIAAILMGGGEGDKRWSLLFVLFLLLPGMCRMFLSREKTGGRHRSGKKRR
jgi:hypothetical protein